MLFNKNGVLRNPGLEYMGGKCGPSEENDAGEHAFFCDRPYHILNAVNFVYNNLMNTCKKVIFLFLMSLKMQRCCLAN